MPDRAIVVRLQGGLGNQMFQYALGRQLASIRGGELRLDVDSLLPDPKRRYELGHFNIRAGAADPSDLGGPEFCERSLRFDPAVFDSPAGHVLRGYWQSEKYFYGIRHELAREFTLRAPVSAEADALAREILECGQAVMLHVRRTDAVGAPCQPLVPLEYYERAAALLWHRFPALRLFVFSDDLPWCREHLRLGHPTTFVEAPAAHEALWLMSLCRHAIVANSTFSWWAAWLGDLRGFRDRMVIAPGFWFTPGLGLESEDIVPERWVEMSLDRVEIESRRRQYPLTPESVVFDLGGYRGDWAAEIAAKYDPHIHIFEPVPSFAAGIAARFRENPKVRVHNVGVSDRDKSARISVAGDASSLHKCFADDLFVQLWDAAALCERARVDAVDLIKINIEGEEYAVLTRLAQSRQIARFRDVQVQFHRFFEDSETARDNLRGMLARTHSCAWEWPFVWESWTRL